METDVFPPSNSECLGKGRQQNLFYVNKWREDAKFLLFKSGRDFNWRALVGEFYIKKTIFLSVQKLAFLNGLGGNSCLVIGKWAFVPEPGDRRTVQFASDVDFHPLERACCWEVGCLRDCVHG